MIAVDLTGLRHDEINLRLFNPRAQSNCILAVKVDAGEIADAIKSAAGYFCPGCIVSLVAAPLTEKSSPQPAETILVMIKGHSAHREKFASIAMLAGQECWAKPILDHYRHIR